MSGLVLIDQFTATAADERTRSVVAALPQSGLASLDEILLRFNYRRDRLSENAAALALRVILRLQEPGPVAFAKLLAILDYLDINRNFTVDNGELGMAVEVLETFSRVDDAPETMSNLELDMLLAVLEHIDSDGDGRLVRAEISSLRDQLWNPGPFFERQKQTNSKLRQLLASASDE